MVRTRQLGDLTHASKFAMGHATQEANPPDTRSSNRRALLRLVVRFPFCKKIYIESYRLERGTEPSVQTS